VIGVSSGWLVDVTVLKVDGEVVLVVGAGGEVAEVPTDVSPHASNEEMAKARAPARLAVVPRGRDHLVAAILFVGCAEEGLAVIAGVVDKTRPSYSRTT
jgi:hypothetical protein